MYVRAACHRCLSAHERQRERKEIVAALLALCSPSFFFHPSPPLPQYLPPASPPSGDPPRENSDDHALRCVFFLSFLPSSSPPPPPLFFLPSALLFFRFIYSFFFFFFYTSSFLSLRRYRSCVPVYVYRRNSMYILYARTPRSNPFPVCTYTFVWLDVRIVINTGRRELASLCTMRDAFPCAWPLRAHVSSLRLVLRPGPLIKFVSSNVHGVTASIPCLFPIPSNFPESVSGLLVRSLSLFLHFFLSLFPTCSSPIGSAVRLAASRERERGGENSRFVLCRCNDERGEKRGMISRGFHGVSYPRFLFSFFLFQYGTGELWPRFDTIMVVGDGCYFRAGISTSYEKMILWALRRIANVRRC